MFSSQSNIFLVSTARFILYFKNLYPEKDMLQRSSYMVKSLLRQ